MCWDRLDDKMLSNARDPRGGPFSHAAFWFHQEPPPEHAWNERNEGGDGWIRGR